MDRLLVTGGARLAGTDPRLRRQELRAEADGRGAPRARAHRAAQRARGSRTACMMGEVLEHLGAGVAWDGRHRHDRRDRRSRRSRRPTTWCGRCAPRSSCSGRCSRARAAPEVAMPGGDNIGSRPIDLHISGLRKMGAEIRAEHGFLYAETDGLRGASITLDYPSVGATENLMMAAVAAQGHHRARQRRARARDRRPRRLPERDGRADRGRGHRARSRSRAWTRSRPPSTA